MDKNSVTMNVHERLVELFKYQLSLHDSDTSKCVSLEPDELEADEAMKQLNFYDESHPKQSSRGASINVEFLHRDQFTNDITPQTIHLTPSLIQNTQMNYLKVTSAGQQMNFLTDLDQFDPFQYLMVTFTREDLSTNITSIQETWSGILNDCYITSEADKDCDMNHDMVEDSQATLSFNSKPSMVGNCDETVSLEPRANKILVGHQFMASEIDPGYRYGAFFTGFKSYCHATDPVYNR